MWRPLVVSVLVLMVAQGGAAEDPAAELGAVERGFAETMADRDLTAFAGYLDAEVVFITGDRVLRGRDAVVAGWAPYFEDEAAPFAWAPEAVEVLASGELGFSSGPVLAPDGRRVGTFNSVWRRTADGWRIVFDRGCPPCAGTSPSKVDGGPGQREVGGE